jgi:hypothetical protein
VSCVPCSQGGAGSQGRASGVRCQEPAKKQRRRDVYARRTTTTMPIGLDVRAWQGDVRGVAQSRVLLCYASWAITPCSLRRPLLPGA